MSTKNTKPAPEILSENAYLTINEVMQILRMSRKKLWRLRKAKSEADRLPFYRIGGSILCRVEELRWYVDNHREN